MDEITILVGKDARSLKSPFRQFGIHLVALSLSSRWLRRAGCVHISSHRLLDFLLFSF